MTALLAIILATLVSEDLTCITSGLLVSQERLALATALVGCYVGILAGDIGLWLIGYSLGAKVLQLPRVRRRLRADRVDSAAEWLDRHAPAAVLAARFVPGTRLPTYLAAGALGRRSGRFVLWAAVAGLAWTPLLVGLVAWFGEPLVRPLENVLGNAWIAVGAAAVLLFLLPRLVRLLFTQAGRVRLGAAISRTWRWEFWPIWLFYLPLLPWIAWLAMRHRGLGALTAANPGIPHGGFVGESKYDILARLPPELIVPTERIAPGEPGARLAALGDSMRNRGWEFPIVLKPDVGERGAGVRLIRDAEQARAYFRRYGESILAQAYHPGPFEAGVFYYRLPEEPSGRIFSITDKQFPVLVGDGERSVRQLIWRHPRFRMQADRFIARLNGQADIVLGPGEPLRLCIAGNHCQGTMFCDGGHLITPELERAFDRIARGFDGFCFGRFDVRYADAAEFRSGRGFAIVELNGATSESTNVYDPSWPLLRAYGVLYRQWAILFEIGSENRRRGASATPALTLLRHTAAYYRRRKVDPLAD